MPTISSISCLVNMPLPARRSRNREPMAPSTLRTRLFAFERVYVSTSTAYSMYFTDGKLVRANNCSNSTLLSLLSPLLILCNGEIHKRTNFSNEFEEFDDQDKDSLCTYGRYQGRECPSFSCFRQIHKV